MINASNFKGPTFEVIKGHSRTIPDMTLSLRDLLNRHKAGAKTKVFEPVYTGDNSMIPIDFERMDQTEKVALAMKVADFIETSRGRLISARQKAQLDAHEKALEEKIAARLAAKAADAALETAQGVLFVYRYKTRPAFAILAAM